ncbi:MAG TPA: hypothetical protein VFU81_09935, partial [Thermomicrobiales bacterium]|nr:hypothetical protein [Thermomicrobiales bacterium]
MVPHLMMLDFEPLISPALWAAMALAAAVLLGVYAWQRPPSATKGRWALIVALMAAGAALPLVILLNPTWQIAVPPPAGKPLLTIVADASASMSAGDLPGGQTRRQAAVAIASACAEELADKFDVRAVDFSSHTVGADPLSLERRAADGESTDLAAEIIGSLANDRPRGQALLLLSDGIHNAPDGTTGVLSALSVARASAAPIYVKTLGGAAEINDLALRLHSP